MTAAPTLDDLRRYAVARTLFKPTTLPAAIQRLGFVQGDWWGLGVGIGGQVLPFASS